MPKYIIATHGNLASGYKNSLEILLGKDIADKIVPVNAFTEDKNPKEVIDSHVSALNQNDQLIIFTDWLNGSVNQACIPHASKDNVYILSGINLPLMCEVLITIEAAEDGIDEAFLRSAVSNAKKEIIYVNDACKSADDGGLTEEADFF